MSNPAAFWQAYRVKKTTCIAIPVEQLANAYQILHGPTIHCTHQQCTIIEDDEQINTMHHAEQINANVQTQEVQAAFKRLRRRKAAGIDGIKAERLLDDICIMTYFYNPWLTHSLICFTIAFQLHGAKVSFTPSSKQVHVMIHLIIEA